QGLFGMFLGPRRGRETSQTALKLSAIRCSALLQSSLKSVVSNSEFQLRPNYIELHARSAFSFLRGSSSPEHLAFTAADLQLPALALCDRDGVFGAPRFYTAAGECGIRPIVGSELTMEDGSVLPVLVQSRNGYQNLCRLLSRARLRSPKNESSIGWSELSEFQEGLICLTGDEEGPLHQALLTRDFSRADQC